MINESDVEVTVVTQGSWEQYRYLHLPTRVAVSDHRIASGAQSARQFREEMFFRLDACVRADKETFGE